jgi:hypothetical protein
MPNFRRLGQLILIAIGMPLVAACGQSEEPKTAAPTAAKTEPAMTPVATPQPASPQELETALRERVERYWAARQVRDVRTLYELESAARPGGWLKLENAMSLIGLPVRNVKIQEVKIEGERAMTRISGEVMIGTLGWTPQTLEDLWVLIDGLWYHQTSR